MMFQRNPLPADVGAQFIDQRFPGFLRASEARNIGVDFVRGDHRVGLRKKEFQESSKPMGLGGETQPLAEASLLIASWAILRKRIN